MKLHLEKKIALITGASKGIGLAVAHSLASEGCTLQLVSRTAADLERVATELKTAYSVPVNVHALDLSDSAQLDILAEAVDSVDILVNNAGAIPGGNLADTDEISWREAWDLKVFGYINLSRRIYTRMQADGGGVIINIIGVMGERPSADYIAGSVGNAALMALTRALGAASLQDNIRVLGINPGVTETERLIETLRGFANKHFDDPERWRELMDPNNPPGKPEYIGDLVAFLASDRSANTTGTIITADGGLSAR